MKTKTAMPLVAALIVVLGLSAGAAQATTVGNNFTMIDPSGGLVTGGANDVVASWDLSLNTSSTGTNFNMTLSSVTPFFGALWTAHDVRVFGSGSYSFNTGCTTAELEANGGASCAVTGPTLSMTVGAGQLGVHMLFDWNGNQNIDVAMVWNQNTTFGPSPMYTVGGGNPATVWSLASADGNGDGKNGIPMVDGPFVGFNANFNVQVVPVPAAIWLLGSGLLGLVGLARRHKNLL